MRLSRVRTVFTLVLLLAVGFVSGLVISGRMSLTSPSTAAPEQTQQPARPPAAAVARAAAAMPDLSPVAVAALQVAANISSTITVPLDPFWQMFSGNRVQQSQSLGSGVVVSPDGYILTNTHVIGSARAEVRVTLADGRERPAKIIGSDDVSDLAVIKVDATDLPTIPWGDSQNLRVAEWVLAVGNPFQLSGTVTLGIVSTIKRAGDQIGSHQDFIQTDAAINPGNSGGALINARGELVGINTMIYSETGGYQGIGFAIPSNAARAIMTELIQNGSVSSWGSIGAIEWITIDQAMVARYNVDVTGAFVRSITRNSPAYRAGLEPGDTVVTLNGQPVASGDQIERTVIRQKVGTSVALGVVKRDGRKATIDVAVVSRQTQATRQR